MSTRQLQASVLPPTLMAEVQGNILRAYGGAYRVVRHLVLCVEDPIAARRALAMMVNGDRSTPDVTPGDRAPREAGFRWCLNLGFTYSGLVRLGVPAESLATFPPEYRQGMAPRAARLGDIGASSAKHWVGGLGTPEKAHLIATIHGWETSDVDEVAGRVLESGRGRAFSSLGPEIFDGEVICDPETGRRTVHFGYADGISQPRFLGVHDPQDYPDRLPFVSIGAVLLGYPSTIPHVTWNVPQPDVLGRDGAFNAFRVLGQDVAGFERLLARVETDHGHGGIDRELVAAKLCGRWRSGVPLSLAPTRAEEQAFTDDADLNDFDFSGGEAAGDFDGVVCPIGSHIRRVNPRAAHIVQRSANRTRVLIRRGMPYGPPWDPADPSTHDAPRGLLGNFICASLSAQFEALQYDWINLGFQDPRITGSNDPLIGANDPRTSSFTWPRPGADPLVIGGLDRFVFTRGGAYTFLPSIPSIRWISEQGTSSQ